MYRKTAVFLSLALTLVLTYLISAPRVANFAYADTPPLHVIITSEVYLEDLAPPNARLFRLPLGYYIKVDSLKDGYYYLSFNGKPGRVPQQSVKTTEYSGPEASTIVDLAIAQQDFDIASIEIKKAPSAQSARAFTLSNDNSFRFIGDYIDEGNVRWFYILYNGSYGYIRALRTSSPNLTVPTFSPSHDPAYGDPGGADEDPADTPKVTELRMLIIVGVAVPVLLIILLIFKPGRKYDSDT